MFANGTKLREKKVEESAKQTDKKQSRGNLQIEKKPF